MTTHIALVDLLGYEWMAVSSSENKAKQVVFEGINTYIQRQIEYKNDKGIATHEFLEKELIKYYKKHFKGDVSIETLEKKHPIHILDIKKEECYRNGYQVPKRIQDF